MSHKDKILIKIKSFPHLPGALEKLLAFPAGEDRKTDQVDKILQSDPGLASEALNLSRTSYFGGPSKANSVSEVVTQLGFNRLNYLVLAAWMRSLMAQPVPGYSLSSGRLWGHSIAVAVTAERLIKELNIPNAAEVSFAALLHDVGKLVLGDFVKQELLAIEKITAQGLSFEEAERRVLGIDHAEVGACIVEDWSFPSEVAKGVRWHHIPDSPYGESPLTDIVHVANVLCLMMGIGVGREGLRCEPSPSATERLNLKTKQLEVVASQALQWVNELTGGEQEGLEKRGEDLSSNGDT